MMRIVLGACLLLSLCVAGFSFQPPPPPAALKHGAQVITLLSLHAQKNDNKNENKSGSWTNPFQELSSIMSSLDDVIDDFMGKRMGNGEVFYGQRKYKPSGRDNTQGQYSGMGLSDKMRIDIAKERKEEYLAMKRERQEKDSQRGTQT